jgi:hypothetical protein
MSDETVRMDRDSDDKSKKDFRVILRDGRSVSVEGSENLDETVSMNKRTVAYRDEAEKTRIISNVKAMAWRRKEKMWVQCTD